MSNQPGRTNQDERTRPERTNPIWPDGSDMPDFPELEGAIDTEVCVVGAGIAGMTTAYLLAREGVRVVVLDHGPVGGGETGRTTAHLSNAIDEGIRLIEKMHGEAGARVAVESHGAAIDRIEAIVREEEIDCDFTRLDGYLILAPGDSPEVLSEELEAVHRAGLKEVEWTRPPLETFGDRVCLRFPRQAQFHPLRFLSALARAIERDGGRVFTHSRVNELEDGSPVTLSTTGRASVRAERVVVATNSPIVDLMALHTKQAAYRTFVVGLEVPEGSVPQALYWDTGDPYHYVRLAHPAPGEESAGLASGGSNVLIVGGGDHKTGQADDGEARFDHLEVWARKFFPSVRRVTHRWSGQVLEPVDGVAFIGPSPGSENIYVITGDSGQGMTHGVLGAMILTDLIRGRDNPWADFYAPTRTTLAPHSGIEWLKENVNVAYQYVDHVRRETEAPSDEMPLHAGLVVRRDGKQIAVYRDGTGSCHEMSALCTHMMCVVQWNSTEGSWDCPCHGSRFDPYGKVLNAPAVHELEPLPQQAEVAEE